jgi:hypothetical protein
MTFSALVDNILTLLGEADTLAPPAHASAEVAPVGPGDPAVQAEPITLNKTDSTENRKLAMTRLQASVNKNLKAAPAGATEAQLKLLEHLRLRFANACSNIAQAPDLDRLEHIKETFAALQRAQSEILDQIKYRAELGERLEALTPAAKSGPALVPGAAEADTRVLESLRDDAQRALIAASTPEEHLAVDGLVHQLSQELDRIANLVADRQLLADQINSDAAKLIAPPEAPPGTLEAERGQVTLALTPPLSQDKISAARGALSTLEAAWQVAAQEAIGLRQIRAMYRKELAALEGRFETLKASLGPNQQKAKNVTDVLGQFTRCQNCLRVDASKIETLEFPTLLTAAKVLIDELLKSVISTNASAKNYVRYEFEALEQQANGLPAFDADSNKHKADAERAIKAIELLLKGGGTKADAARKQLPGLAATIDAWAAHLGPARMVLDQRKAHVTTQIDKSDPKGASAAFALALKTIRDQVKLSLAKPVNETNVTEAETRVNPLGALLSQAAEDAKAASRVHTMRQTLDAELQGVIDNARSVTQIELIKARDFAHGRAALTDVTRDMPRTARLHEALIARMNEVKAEANLASADKAIFSAIEEAVQAKAFDLCGPDLLKSLNDTARKALSDALVSDGPAIEDLAQNAFGGHAKVLANVMGTCGVGGLTVLARALSGDGAAAARVALDGLIDKGGLGEHPEILAQLVGEAPKPSDSQEVREAKEERQVRNCAALKCLADNFEGEDGQAAMNTLLNDCALSASPGALASLLQDDGFDGKGEDLREFADAFSGSSPDQAAHRSNFARIVKDGGMATHPKVLGPLAKNGGAEGIKQIGSAFVAPQDCTNLKGLLDRGGMGGDTSTPTTRHEHPDTLSKVFVEGLGGKGENLKTFAKAFSGAAGQAKAKEMLDAFNEFADVHAESRQPGKGIEGLLDGQHLKGTTAQKIEKLSSQFVPQIRNIGNLDQRKQAIRMAPSFGTETAQEGWKPKSPAMAKAKIERVTASVLKRHQPETFDRSKMKAVEQSMFPPGTDVGDLIDQALRKVGSDRSVAWTGSVLTGDPPTAITVEMGFLNGNVVNHFGPRRNVGPPHPQETPTFTNAEINAIYAAAF